MPTALVTGAGIRIGRAVALHLARAGYQLILHAHSSSDAAEAVAGEVRLLGGHAEVRTADLSSPGDVDRLGAELCAAHPRLELLVHNAGIFERVPFAETSREAYRRMQAVNLEAPFFLTQALLPSLRAAGSALVVHIGDIGGERPVPRYAHYSVSKAGLLMLTKALAVELAPDIRVNAISPGTVAFPEGFDDVARQAVLARVPMKREGEVDDIARAVVFLAKEAPYVTGQVINVDGGRSAVL